MRRLRGWKPVLLALAVVAAVFGAALLVGRDSPATSRTVAPKAPPRPVAEVTVPAAIEPPTQPPSQPPPSQAVTEPEPGVAYEEPGVPAAPRPPAEPPAVAPPAALPPPPVPPVAGTPLWRRNALPFVMPRDRPVIAIVIDDLGLDRKRSARTVALPGPLTLSWLPYAHDLRAQAAAGRAAGHELLLHMPMEPSVHADPGPDALLTSLGPAEVMRRFTRALDSFDGYVGVNNHMGSRFTADRAALAPVLGELSRRGLLWLDSRTTPHSAGLALARELRMPFAGRDIFLDNVQTVAAVRGQFAKTEAVARHQGYAIAIGHPHDATIAALAAWLPDLRAHGFTLVPVSAIVRARCACG